MTPLPNFLIYSRVRRIGETFHAENLHLYAGFHLYAGRRGRYALIGQLKQDLEFIIYLKGSQSKNLG
jgi:hypothetical protein